MVLQRADDSDLYALLAQETRPRLLNALQVAEPGQRLRVTSLPEPVMERVCATLQDGPWVARVLTAGAPDAEWKATATKLIELRNVLDQPLLTFIPPGLRTAAEDSLDIATFTELPLASLASDLTGILLARLPVTLKPTVEEELGYLRTEGAIRNADEVVEYLLTVLKNGATPEVAGGALHVFGLVPDFHLFTRGSPRFWLSRNRKACERLTDTKQPLQSRLRALGLRPGSLQGPLFAFLRERQGVDARTWAREVACDAKYRNLAFENWAFADGGEAEELRLVLEPLSLPLQTKDVVSGAAQLPLLNLGGRDPLKVVFRSLPGPGQVPAWKTFRIQLLRVGEGGGAVAWESNSFPKPQGRTSLMRRSIKVADLQALEEGTYYVKVDAYDGEGALLTRPRRVNPDDESSRAENESERFLVVREGTPIEDPDVRAVFVGSLLEAWVEASARVLGSKSRKGETLPARTGVSGAWDVPVGVPVRGSAHFELKSEGFAGFSVVVPSLLRRAELDLLEHPERFAVYALSLREARTLADVQLEAREALALGQGGEVDEFLVARREAFTAIRTHHFDPTQTPPEKQAVLAGVLEAVDLARHAKAIERYAKAYLALARAAVSDGQDGRGQPERVRALALLDTIELRWRPSAGDPGRALLVAPTHPLRMLWHLRHTLACEAAVSAWETGTMQVPSWREHLAQLEGGLLPLNLPTVLFDRRGRGYVEHAPLTSFWSLYLPDRAEGNVPVDAVAMRDRVLAALAVRAREVGVVTVEPAEVAHRLFEYLAQHPYLEQLHLNVFNPGDGRLVANVLREVERLRAALRPTPPALRYSVHLFAAAEHVESGIDGLESLLDPERQVGEDDEFALETSNHLRPKLVFSRHATAEFLQAPERFSGHVALLLEQFPVQCRVGRVDGLRRGSFVGGLVQEPEMQLETQGALFGWVKGLNPALPANLSEKEGLLTSVVRAAQTVQASHALGRPVAEGVAPLVALQLDAGSQALLKQVHEACGWVLTVDRNLGLDYFDSPTSVRDTGFLLDFAPEYLQEDRQRLLLTTRSTEELETVLRPSLERHGLALRSGEDVVLLETLRSLSGRLALKLEQGWTQASEVVGLLLARWLLDRAGLLAHRLLIPLDAHRSWFAADEEGGSQRRADLLLVSMPEAGIVRMDVVEVKLREQLSAAARSELYADMRKQTENTEQRLRTLFAQDLFALPRADAALRAKELGSTLAFYVRRACRYGLVSDAEAQAMLGRVERLGEGYRLELRSLGVVFERQAVGLHVDEEEPGFVVHRLGGDKARQLLADALGRFSERESRSSQGDASSKRSLLPTLALERMEEALAFTDEDAAPVQRALAVQVYPNVTPSKVPEAREPEARYPEAATAAPAQPADAPVLPSGAGEDPRPGDVLLGAGDWTRQTGVLGKSGGLKVALDLNGCNTISLFGVQGFGKSYTLGVIAEMATARVPGINTLPAPLATVIFHYHKSDAYAPEYASAVDPNAKPDEVERLLREYGASPQGLKDVVLLSPEAKVEQRRREYPGLTVEPIKFSSAELGAESWKFLLGAYGNDSLYLKQLVAIMRRHRSDLTVKTLRKELEDADLPKGTRRLAEDRLNLAEPYIDDARRLSSLLRPGRTVVVDLRDEWIEKDEALGLFVVMLRIFAQAKHEGRDFNKLVVFDEAHKYITESELIGQVVETIREMRHQATSVLIASQDPLSVPRAVIELTSVLVLHRMSSPQWLKHLKGAIVALESIADAQVTTLKPGEALVWAQRCTDARFVQRPQKVVIRPRVSRHGGGTKTAVQGDSVR
ncbi:ATP-binding protein [Corallococcus exiguus]|uniref:ATP-binding protein n=1 Tax=Corallococcus exiguus TaxID=83462 RepID=UPI001471ECC4|nr:ATP-binding protein [Corallococcus exiguus]NNC16695.1 ATP-binding protein [Corallococcus exiguus]